MSENYKLFLSANSFEGNKTNSFVNTLKADPFITVASGSNILLSIQIRIWFGFRILLLIPNIIAIRAWIHIPIFYLEAF